MTMVKTREPVVVGSNISVSNRTHSHGHKVEAVNVRPIRPEVRGAQIVATFLDCIVNEDASDDVGGNAEEVKQQPFYLFPFHAQRRNLRKNRLV
eukprot:25555_5